MAVIKHHDQSQPGRKMFYFILQLSGHTPSSLPESGQKLKARTWEQKLQQKPDGCLLACSPCSVFLLIPLPPLTCPQVSLAVGIFSSQVCLGLCQADIRSASAPSGCVWYVTMSQLFHWLGLVDMTQRQRAYLACARPWVSFLVLPTSPTKGKIKSLWSLQRLLLRDLRP